eukprot:m.480036 g.480036  ORF g.480036 m.480036 type:complete len:238 (-) comp21674_c0_seq1:203-916(-)
MHTQFPTGSNLAAMSLASVVVVAVGAIALAACGSAKPVFNVTKPAGPWGPDVSHYQGTVDWNKVKGAGASFAFVKATEGTSYTDTTFKRNWEGMRAAGIARRGAYHFGHPGSSASAQASHFVSTVGSMENSEVLVLDIETSDNQGPSEVAKWCGEFLSAVMKLSKLPASRVYVYTGEWFWDPKAGGSSVASAHPLWVSGYTSSPPMPKGWSSWTYWQYTDKGSVPGVDGGCDVSVSK